MSHFRSPVNHLHSGGGRQERYQVRAIETEDGNTADIEEEINRITPSGYELVAATSPHPGELILFFRGIPA